MEEVREAWHTFMLQRGRGCSYRSHLKLQHRFSYPLIPSGRVREVEIEMQ